jgi:hypothetical protein
MNADALDRLAALAEASICNVIVNSLGIYAPNQSYAIHICLHVRTSDGEWRCSNYPHFIGMWRECGGH